MNIHLLEELPYIELNAKHAYKYPESLLERKPKTKNNNNKNHKVI